MRYLKENTATRVTVGPFLDVTDAITPEVALTVTACHLTFMVDDAGVPTLVIDAAPTASAGNNDMVHVTSDIAGFYDLELTAAQTNYTGRAMLMIHDTDVHLPVFHEFQIISANVYDSLFTDGDVLDVNVTQWLGTAAATPTTAGVPEVDVTHVSGTAQTANDNGADINTLVTQVGTAGAGLTDLGGMSTTMKAQVNTEADTALTDYDPPTNTEMLAATAVTDALVVALNDPTAAAVADAVWDEAQSGHVAAGSFGVTASEIASILVDTGEIGTAGAGLTNINLPNQTMDITGTINGPVTGSVGSVAGNVDGNVTGSVGSVTGAVGSVAGNVDGNVTGSVGSNLELGPAEVNAEVLDVLNTDTFAEPGQGAPGATISLAAKIGYLYKAWRNRSNQTATTYQLYADDATTVDQKVTVSDDATTAEKGEVGTGP